MICKIVYFSLLLGCAFSRPDGAPIGACGDMTPRHPENTPSDLANNPYQVSANMSVNGKISGRKQSYCSSEIMEKCYWCKSFILTKTLWEPCPIY